MLPGDSLGPYAVADRPRTSKPAELGAQADVASTAAGIYKADAMPVVELPDEAASAAFAARLAAVAAAGDIIALKGELGVGKTSFARAFIRARGSAEAVPSPTFTLVQVYDVAPAAIWHFDLYRLSSPDEAWELGIEDAFGEAISLIEWPERLGSLLPRHRLEITLLFGDGPEERRAVLDAGEDWQRRLLGVIPGA